MSEEPLNRNFSHLPPQPIAFTPSLDSTEALLEAQEASQYLLAKSFFDCREYARCAAVFLSDGSLYGITTTHIKQQSPRAKGKGKPSLGLGDSAHSFPKLSQRSLFLTLYAKFMAGEKRKDEESEMVLGPLDGGVTSNRELVGLSQGLATWFKEHEGKNGTVPGSEGWLEYL